MKLPRKSLLNILVLVLLIIFYSPTVYASERAVTYIGNYEVTESEEIKKEVVRVAGGMGKVVKSREKNIKTRDIPQWEYKYITTDSQGSTRQELTENNIQTNTIPKPNTYYAYGSVIQSASVGSRVLNAQTQVVEDTYTGQKKDEETGLMYYNARYYNPQTGLFVQADSVDDTPNKYQYVASNPISNIDPSGNAGKCLPTICGGSNEDLEQEGYVDQEAETLGEKIVKNTAYFVDLFGLCFTDNCKKWVSPEGHRQNTLNQAIPEPATISSSFASLFRKAPKKVIATGVEGTFLGDLFDSAYIKLGKGESAAGEIKALGNHLNTPTRKGGMSTSIIPTSKLNPDKDGAFFNLAALEHERPTYMHASKSTSSQLIIDTRVYKDLAAGSLEAQGLFLDAARTDILTRAQHLQQLSSAVDAVEVSWRFSQKYQRPFYQFALPTKYPTSGGRFVSNFTDFD